MARPIGEEVGDRALFRRPHLLASRAGRRRPGARGFAQVHRRAERRFALRNLSRLISDIVAKRFCSIEMRAWTYDWRSFAA